MARLITQAYLLEQKHLHFEHPQKHKYGTGGPQFAELIGTICAFHGLNDLLDYGCGKSILKRDLNPAIEYHGYDPAIELYALPPEPRDMVACLDVLEHIEPECLAAVLDHLRALTKRFLFASISLEAAGRDLRDGRNSHLIIKSKAWWLNEMETHGLIQVAEYPTQKVEHVALWRTS